MCQPMLGPVICPNLFVLLCIILKISLNESRKICSLYYKHNVNQMDNIIYDNTLCT